MGDRAPLVTLVGFSGAFAARVGDEVDQRDLLRRLVDLQYERNDMNLVRGKFRVRGDVLEVHPAYEESAVRIELFGDEIESISVVDPLTGVLPPAVVITGPELTPEEEAANIAAAEGAELESEQELAACRAAGATALGLGPRVLRTETAGLAALAALQAKWGDF